MKINWLYLIETYVLCTAFSIVGSALGLTSGILMLGGFLIGFFSTKILSWVHGKHMGLFLVD